MVKNIFVRLIQHSMTEFKAIVAISDNYVIANENGIPWSIEKDYKHYKSTIKGNITISGRVTYEASGSKPSGKKQVVLTRNENWSSEYDSVYKANSIDESIEIANELASDKQDIFVIGGENIYREFLEIYDKMIISHIKGEYNGNRYFPKFNKEDWNIIDKEEYDRFNIVYYAK